MIPLENMHIVLPLGIFSIVFTIYLCLTGDRNVTEKKIDIDNNYIKISRIKIDIFTLVYLFIFIMMVIVGIFSKFCIIPLIIASVFAFIPLILMIFIRFYSNEKKES
jgi:di/tricarboxylate transporter